MDAGDDRDGQGGQALHHAAALGEELRAGRVVEGADLAQVMAGAEAGTGTAQDEHADGRVGGDGFEQGFERGEHCDRERIP